MSLDKVLCFVYVSFIETNGELPTHTLIHTVKTKSGIMLYKTSGEFNTVTQITIQVIVTLCMLSCFTITKIEINIIVFYLK